MATTHLDFIGDVSYFSRQKWAVRSGFSQLSSPCRFKPDLLAAPPDSLLRMRN